MNAHPVPPVVLNVDDSDERVRFRTTILHESGFEVVEARTGGDALGIAAVRKPSLVLLDVKLPDMDGIEVCRRLKANVATRAIPVLHVSAAFPDDEHWVKGLQVGADAYLPEPVSADVLVEVIRTLLRRAEAETIAYRARREAENALRLSERRYRALFEHAPYGIFQAALDGRLLAVNRALARILGFDSERDVLAARTIHGFYADPADASRVTAEIDRRRVIKGVEVLWKRKSGERIPVRMSGRRIEAGYETFVEDVTERQVLEEQRRQSQKLEAIGRLAGGVAHDFNNALTVILGYADMLSTQLGTDKPIGRDVDEIRRAAQHAASLTHQLLAFSRQQPLQLSVVDLNEVVNDARGMVERLIGETIAVRTEMADRVCPVKADPAQLQQILVNLAANARDAMPDGGTLVIETMPVFIDSLSTVGLPSMKPGRYVRLTVRDTGVGMDDATKRQLFEPFFTTKEVGKGTGLGLSTVYGIVKQSGGYICVDSAVNAGTQFVLYFPETEEPLSAVVEYSSLDVAGAAATVLVVEDQPSVRALAAAVLRRHGYLVLEAEGSAQAMALPDDVVAGVDLLLTDLVMPFMSGRGLAKRLTVRHPGLRVLYMSGYIGHEGDTENNAAQDTILRKPFTTHELLEAVKEALGTVATRLSTSTKAC